MSSQCNEDAWQRSCPYAYYNNNRQPTNSTSPLSSSSSPMSMYTSAPPTMSMARQHPSYQPMYHQAYPPSSYYPQPAPMQAPMPQYHDANDSVYALQRNANPSSTSYSDMLALNMIDTDFDDVRMLQEMLLTPHPVDSDEAKTMEPMLMFQPFSRPLVHSTAATATSTISISQPSTPHSEASSCESHALPARMARSRKSQRKIPTTRICRVPECNKGIRSRGLCKAHGGGRRCQTPGCTISDQGGGHCIAHGGGKRCTVGGCDKSAQFKGLCKVHGGSRRCRVADCDKNGQIKGLCRQHYTQSVQENGEDDDY